MTTPVLPARIQIAKDFGLDNVGDAALACREVGLPFYAACALLQKESMGRNVYGHDEGGALSGYPYEVDLSNFRVFRWLVIDKGGTSNGVGPCQITWAGEIVPGQGRTGGFFLQMELRGLKAWEPYDNMLFGFGLLWDYYEQSGSWAKAGSRYNGRPLGVEITAYGRDLRAKIIEWHDRFGIRGEP